MSERYFEQTQTQEKSENEEERILAAVEDYLFEEAEKIEKAMSPEEAKRLAALYGINIFEKQF